MIKVMRLELIGRQFDNQYSLDFQDYMTRHDFYSTMDLFNEAVRQHPPPGHKAIWLITLLTVWILAGTTAYIVWVYGHQSPYILLIVPFVMLLTTIIWLWRYRYLQSIFQSSLAELCSRINATENIRGINFRLAKKPYTMTNDDAPMSTGACGTSMNAAHYALMIEFDDRFLALQSQTLNSGASGVPMIYCSSSLTPQQPAMAHLSQTVYHGVGITDEKHRPWSSTVWPEALEKP